MLPVLPSRDNPLSSCFCPVPWHLLVWVTQADQVRGGRHEKEVSSEDDQELILEVSAKEGASTPDAPAFWALPWGCALKGQNVSVSF